MMNLWWWKQGRDKRQGRQETFLKEDDDAIMVDINQIPDDDDLGLDETELEQEPAMPFTIHDILMKCIGHKDNEELIAMMVSALQDRGVGDVMEFQNMNWEAIARNRLC
jgi:hypothetical protein